MRADGLMESVERRLTRSQLPGPVAAIVRAAFGAEDAVDRLIEGGEVSGVGGATEDSRAASVHAYIVSVDVEGFRGISERARLDVAPGPGLTLVIGRNGSGKSSFAEALEIAFTGDNPRWARRSAVWREGWKNLHHDHTEISVVLAVEGVVGETIVTRSWADGAGLDESRVTVQPHALPKTDLGFLGWDEALPMYRPFLSYSELGSMFDEGPTKIHDAVSSVLGLDELTAAEKALRAARLEREKAVKAVLERRDEIVSLLEGVDDERARQCVAALQGSQLQLDIVETVATFGASASAEGELARLRRVTAVERPDREHVLAVARELRQAHAAVAEVAGTMDDAMLRSADLLEAALEYVDQFPTLDCPVCNTPGVLGPEWSDRARAQVHEQREIARLAQREKERLACAIRAGNALPGTVPSAIQDARGLLDVDALLDAWRPWVELRDERDPLALAAGLESTIDMILSALDAVTGVASREIAEREDLWRPIATVLAAWVAQARPSLTAAARVPHLKLAEAWLKKAAVEIRNDRFAPIADESMEIWKLLRQRSNVELGRIELKGSGMQRKVSLDVTVDGVPGAALGVMSQGELHALALSLFFPRAMLDESPFRFVVVDDPVQSMDPAKVDGLARVLERAAATRQVVVFTHDDRLPEAVRRLGIDATILEVSRRDGSIVELRRALTPIERHIDDARALLNTDTLPDDIARRVVPGFCRLAIEAACIEAVRRRRITRGDEHAAVEAALTQVTRLGQYAALVLFDDPARAGDVGPQIESTYGAAKARAFHAVNRGSHEGYDGDLETLVRDSAILARELAAA